MHVYNVMSSMEWKIEKKRSNFIVTLIGFIGWISRINEHRICNEDSITCVARLKYKHYKPTLLQLKLLLILRTLIIFYFKIILLFEFKPRKFVDRYFLKYIICIYICVCSYRAVVLNANLFLKCVSVRFIFDYND